MSRYRIKQLSKSGEILKIRRGVYVSKEFYSSLNRWEKPLVQICAVYLSSPRAVFSHQSAASLLGLDLIQVPEVIHLYTSPNVRGTRDGVTYHVSLSPETPVALSTIGATCTDLVTTICDLGAAIPHREAVVAADSALRQGLIGKRELQEGLLAYEGRYHRAKIHRVAHALSTLSESAGETLTRLILDDLGVRYIEQYWVPGRNYRVDFYLPDYGICIEFDGAGKYSLRGAPEHEILREKWREDDVTAEGHLMLRTRWEHVYHHPAVFRGRLEHLIRRVHQPKAR